MALSRRLKKRLRVVVLPVAGVLLAGGATAGIISVVKPSTPPPASDQVMKYYEANKDLVTATDDPSEAAKPVAIFLGDSYTQGYGASNVNTRWVTLVSKAKGFKMVNLGRGGSGYVTVAGIEGCGLARCPSYPEMVPLAIDAEPQPTTVVVAGGQNDFIEFARDPEGVTAAIKKTYADLRKGLPKARIVAVGPSTPWDVSSSVVAMDKAVQEAAASVKASYVSLISPNVVKPDMITKDGAHVTDAGHKAIAERVIAALR